MKERDLIERIQNGEFVVNQKPPLAPEIGQRCPVCGNILNGLEECAFCGDLQSWLDKKKQELKQLRKKIEEESREKKEKFLEALLEYFGIKEHPKQEELLNFSFYFAGVSGCNGGSVMNISDQLAIFEVFRKLVQLIR